MRSLAIFSALVLLLIAPAARAESLSAGMSGSGVSELQLLLTTAGYFSYEITGFFGHITLGALQRFQCVKMGICSGSPDTTGWGAYGPRTRAALTYGLGTPTPVPPPGGTAALIASLLEQVRLLQAQIAALTGSAQNSWIVSGWSACASGIQTRTVYCSGSAGGHLTDSRCTSVKPPTQQVCGTPVDPSGLCIIGQSRIGECSLY